MLSIEAAMNLIGRFKHVSKSGENPTHAQISTFSTFSPTPPVLEPPRCFLNLYMLLSVTMK